MGTFHHDKGELHGITVVVDTTGPELWVGRCDQVTPEAVILLDADFHDEAASGKSKADYLRQAAAVGIWKRHDRVLVDRKVVTSIRPLGEIDGSA